MFRRTRLASLAVLLVWIGGTEAGQRPDFSGNWVATKEAPASTAPAPGPVLGQQLGLRHDGQTLTITRRVRDMNVTTTYALDGSEARVRLPGALCMGDSESVETAAWDGNGIALTVVGASPPGGGQVNKLNVRRVLRMDSPDTLVVEGTMRDTAQAAPRAVATVYRRSAEPMPGPVAPQGPAKVPATIAQVAWLAGVWVGPAGAVHPVNPVSPVNNEERWTPPAGGSMLAVARTLRGGVMSSFEFLCIAERAGGLVYQAMPNGRAPATDFTLTRLEPNSATFENPAHDFPKAVRYTLGADGTLEAVVSGDAKQRAITFTFKRQEKH